MASDAAELAAGGSRLAGPAGSAEPGWPPHGRSPLLWAGLRRIVQEHQQDRTAPRVLDCGGGSGGLAVPLAVHGAVVTVVDVSVDALATLTRRAAEAGVSDRVTAVQGDAEFLADLVPAGAFDLVLAHDVLEDVPDPVLVLRQVAEVLRPGGMLSVVAANPVAGVLARALAGDLAGALVALSRPAGPDDTVGTLTAQCRAAGLEVRSVEGLGVFTDLVPGIELDRPGALATLADLESAVAGRPPYRDIAARLHLQARRPAAG
ncbi:class I SAM-dependent methyltransferase [Jatrophihabitans sp.]|uniref:class I SAM-dependent methyltransferase n=1 Tax=Jatrophihabitans sp. TaxID=1932789 RepID=UPI002B8F66BA|nr:methyltransferase domain-containing protein [Jatrophihabitans sp.]